MCLEFISCSIAMTQPSAQYMADLRNVYESDSIKLFTSD